LDRLPLGAKYTDFHSENPDQADRLRVPTVEVEHAGMEISLGGILE